MWVPIIGRGMSLVELQAFIDNMKFDHWRPIGMVLHNTGAPTLKQWHNVPGATRMQNLENYFRNERGWSSAPHAFVADDLVWPFTPFNAKGTHSPSWNGTHLGIEMVGDFSVEDDDAGAGLKVKMNTVALFGMLHSKLGLDPDKIKFHKEDPKTTHDCPGKDIEKPEFIRLVKEWMGHGGDYGPPYVPITDTPVAKPVAVRHGVVNVPTNDTLNLRAAAGASSTIVVRLRTGTAVNVLDEDMNGETKWLRVEATGHKGWVATQYVKLED